MDCIGSPLFSGWQTKSDGASPEVRPSKADFQGCRSGRKSLVKPDPADRGVRNVFVGY
ncbi:MAG: hypothetical protein ORO03_04505 [Alphaproteobacteria bacterium]|nr:hypothetical protein [Alphaproteobacteria bacterium]